MEVRVAHTLAVAMGTFTACWIPLIIAMGFCTGKTFSKTEHSSTHVAPNSGSVKLSHELSDLLC